MKFAFASLLALLASASAVSSIRFQDPYSDTFDANEDKAAFPPAPVDFTFHKYANIKSEIRFPKYSGTMRAYIAGQVQKLFEVNNANGVMIYFLTCIL